MGTPVIPDEYTPDEGGTAPLAGKYNSVEEMARGMEELQAAYGRQSQELGELRQRAASTESVTPPEPVDPTKDPAYIAQVDNIAARLFPVYTKNGYSEEEAMEMASVQAQAMIDVSTSMVAPIASMMQSEVAPTALRREVNTFLQTSGADQMGVTAEDVEARIRKDFDVNGVARLDAKGKKAVFELLVQAELGRKAMGDGTQTPPREHVPFTGSASARPAATSKEVTAKATAIVQTSRGAIPMKRALEMAKE